MEYLNEEKVISIKELIYAVISKWRSIMAVVISTAVFVLVINIWNGMGYAGQLSTSAIISAIILQVVLIAVLVLFLMIFVYAVKFVFSDRVKTETELRMTIKVEMLGDISDKHYKKNTWLDRKLRNYIGVKVASDVDEAVERVCNVIAMNNNIKYQKAELKIAVVSSCSTDVAQKCTELINTKKANNIQFFMAGDVMASAEAVKTVNDADCVILAECFGKSKYGVISNTCRQLSLWNKDIMGIVISN